MVEREDVLARDGETVSHEVGTLTAACIIQNFFCVHTGDPTVVPQLLRQVGHLAIALARDVHMTCILCAKRMRVLSLATYRSVARLR